MLVFSNRSRREFIKSISKAGLAALTFFKYQQNLFGAEEEKNELNILNDRPLNAECPMHLLDDSVTPNHRMFVRNNGIVPPAAYDKSLRTWTLRIDGDVKKEKAFTMLELKSLFKHYTYQIVLECGGNGRAGFYPPTPGNQWKYGAVGAPLWTGIRLADVLSYLGLKNSAKYLGYYSMDLHPSGDAKKDVISRGFPISKAMDPMTLIAFEMNGKPLSPLHGYPARIICPGYPASASGKWLKRLWIRNRVHDGEKMTGGAYQVPKYPIQPGDSVSEKDMKIIEKMPVKSIITFPKSGSKISFKNKIEVRGFAWTGEEKVTKVDISFDHGQTWVATKLELAANPFAWQRWRVNIKVPSKGYYEIWARATDTTGRCQSMVIPGWNPKGYLNNAMPRISLEVS